LARAAWISQCTTTATDHHIGAQIDCVSMTRIRMLVGGFVQYVIMNRHLGYGQQMGFFTKIVRA
jgi:hypothetical protein